MKNRAVDAIEKTEEAYLSLEKSPKIIDNFFANQFIGSYMTWIPTRNYSRTYFSMEIINTSEKKPNLRKIPVILII